MNFNFGNLAKAEFTSSSTPRLRPYGIYKVNLTKIEQTELNGKDGTKYPVVALEFTGCGDDKGIFSTNLFIPTSEDDAKRRVYQNKEGHDYERPSSMEEFQYKLMQLVQVLNPEGAQKIKDLCAKGKVNDMNTFVGLIIKAVSNKKEEVANLKLVGKNSNGTIYANLPNICGINKEGELFATNFISKNDIFFSDYELKQQKQYQNAKPTNMDNVNPDKADGADNLLDDIEL